MNNPKETVAEVKENRESLSKDVLAAFSGRRPLITELADRKSLLKDVLAAFSGLRPLIMELADRVKFDDIERRILTGIESEGEIEAGVQIKFEAEILSEAEDLLALEALFNKYDIR